jgi:type IV pilus assembly protein PilM
MFESAINTLLGRKGNDPLISVDIGTSSIKVMQLDVSSSEPKLISAGMAPTPAGAFSNHCIVRTDEVAAAIKGVLEANEIKIRKAVTAVPGPCVFTKKISIAHCDPKELETNIGFEASNYIPHSIDAVRLDYQVVSSSSNSTIDVLLVAVKNDIVDSYTDVLEEAGLEPLIVDVDYFALENMYELAYGKIEGGTIALANIGSRFTSVNIIQNGQSLFTGDVGVGGRLYTDALCETLELKPKEAEGAKQGIIPEGVESALVQETLDRTTEHIASELHRQIGFFWNAAATDQSIDTIYVSGGGSQVNGLLEELRSKTGIDCVKAEPFKKVLCPETFDGDYLNEIAPSMAVSVGLAVRRLGDKKHSY